MDDGWCFLPLFLPLAVNHCSHSREVTQPLASHCAALSRKFPCELVTLLTLVSV